MYLPGYQHPDGTYVVKSSPRGRETSGLPDARERISEQGQFAQPVAPDEAGNELRRVSSESGLGSLRLINYRV